MQCPSCGASTVQVQASDSVQKMSTRKTGLLARQGRFWLILLTCGIWLFVPKRKSHSKVKVQRQTVAVCQSCGNTWTLATAKVK